jgi:hypothetical protein
MIEVEFSVLSRQFPNRYIPIMGQLKKEIIASVAKQDTNQIKINWQFSVLLAYSKLNSHYAAIFYYNKKFIDP